MTCLAFLGLALAAPWQEDDGKARRLIEQLGADFLEEREQARKELEKLGKAAEARLVDALRSPDHRVRKVCLELLAVLKSSKALARGAELFKGDEDESVRDAAFLLLQALGREAEDPLIAALSSSRVEHRKGAVRSLAEMKSEKCAEAMAELHRREGDPELKSAAFQCLKSLGVKPFLLECLGSADPALRRDALEGLARLPGDDVLEAVGRLFGRESEASVLGPAFDYLKASGGKSEPHFTAGLKSVHEHARLRSIDGLRAIRSEGAIPAVAVLLKEEASDPVRTAAADFLKSHGLKAEDALIDALSSASVKVKLEAMRVLGEIRSEKPLERIARLYREDPDAGVHGKSFEYLARLGAKAEKELLGALDDPDKEIRVLAIRALGDARSEAAIGRLLDFLAELDPVVKVAARDALVRIGPPALEAVNRSVEAGKVKRPAAEAILALFHQEEVEAFLDRQLTEEGQSGFYEGQFKDLEAFGTPKAVPVLLRIVQEPGYKFRFSERVERVRDYEIKMRELAVMALGELKDAKAVEPLKAALGEASAPRFTDTIHEELLVSLHKLGEKGPLEEFVKKSSAEAEAGLRGEAKDDACTLLFSLGLILNRVGRREEAREAYLRIVKAAADHKLGPTEANTLPATLYNLACLAALKGDKAGGVEWLGKAVRAGFVDRQWIRMDRDLDALREEEGYRKLLADDKLFERPGD